MLQNGWLNTGDFVRMNEDGYVYFIGRSKDIIRRSGENFAPIEVEEALDSHPGVRASAVSRFRPSSPSYIEFIDALPMTPSQRIAKGRQSVPVTHRG